MIAREKQLGRASCRSLTLDQVRAASVRFHGEIEQLPPPFSAKKIGGTPAYKLARAGKPVDLKAARIRISSFEIVALDGAEVTFTMSVSAGGYVRAVAHELGKDLGCGAHLSSLRRTQAGVFTLADAHRFERIGAVVGQSRSAGPAMPASAQPAARDAFGDRRSICSRPAAERCAGESARVLQGVDGESLRGPA